MPAPVSTRLSREYEMRGAICAAAGHLARCVELCGACGEIVVCLWWDTLGLPILLYWDRYGRTTFELPAVVSIDSITEGGPDEVVC